MNTTDSIVKVLETHHIRPDFTQIEPDLNDFDPEMTPYYPDTIYQRPLVSSCAGCSWVGWNHHRHRAEVVLQVVQPWITTPEQLANLHAGDELNGALIKSLGIVNPESGRYDCGEVYEQNADGTWCLLQATHDWSDRAVKPEDLVLPAILLWEPSARETVQQTPSQQ